MTGCDSERVLQDPDMLKSEKKRRKRTPSLSQPPPPPPLFFFSFFFSFLFFFLFFFGLNDARLLILFTVPGNWGEWGSWGSCSTGCSMARSRACDHPAPANNGVSCAGLGAESTPCKTGACPGEYHVQLCRRWNEYSYVWEEMSTALFWGEMCTTIKKIKIK